MSINTRRTLILGATGMAGHVMLECLRKSDIGGEILGTSRYKEKDLLVFDALWSPEKIDSFFNELGSVSTIVNCIGYLVEASAHFPEVAFRVNAALPKYLERKFKNTETQVIHISTDCVFDGASRGAYRVTDLPTETSTYGLSKHLGELDNDKDWTIRTSIIGPEVVRPLSSASNSGLLHWMLTQPKGAAIKGYTEAYWSGISTIELARCVADNILNGKRGLTHVSRPTSISKYALLEEINSVFNLGLQIATCNLKRVDKSLIPCESLQVTGSYSDMLRGLKQWVDTHPRYLYTNTSI